MSEPNFTQGAFTLPGEAGYEDLTLELARTWGADTIRDSDGTQLSDRILTSGYDIYSTICLIRTRNDWLRENPYALQQAYLMSFPQRALTDNFDIQPLRGYFDQQFSVNLNDDPKEWWQIHNRTTGKLVDPASWSVSENGRIQITNTIPGHRYTANFLVHRIWDEISMYNHVTNDWGDREHLMPVDPIHPEAREQILAYLDEWLESHPRTTVVRFTSMFYNFFWPWADGTGRRFVLNDWGSYEFTVSPAAIRLFEQAKGYRPEAEDFINGGRYWSSHAVPGKVYRDWMDFMHAFVVDFSRECVDRVKAARRKAYVFYNDHWIGLEPTLPGFGKAGFDGIIDGIFNGFEARKVAETEGVSVREIRMHPYFFPTGVNGAPSFLPGGDPVNECRTYWVDIRRALLRKPVDRIGFGGYLHLVKNHPDFVEHVTSLACEFRQLKALHSGGAPYTAPLKVAFLTAWGRQRAWGCCGHFNRDNYYNEAMESLSGLPVETAFLGFEDILKGGIPPDINVIVNAGNDGDAWSGGVYWKHPEIVRQVTEWVSDGGGLIGIGEPSSAPEGSQAFRLTDIFGVDRTLPTVRNQNAFAPQAPPDSHFITKEADEDLTLGKEIGEIKVVSPKTTVLRQRAGSVQIAVHSTGSGRAVYLSGHRFSPVQVRLLHRAIFWAARIENHFPSWTTTNPATECAWFPDSSTLVTINNSMQAEATEVITDEGRRIKVSLLPAGSVIRVI